MLGISVIRGSKILWNSSPKQGCRQTRGEQAALKQPNRFANWRRSIVMLICSNISVLFQKCPSSFHSLAPLQQAQIIAHYWMHHNGAFRDGIRVSINLEISSPVQRAAHQPCRHKETFEICTCAASPNAAFITLFPSPLRAPPAFLQTGCFTLARWQQPAPPCWGRDVCQSIIVSACPLSFPKLGVHEPQSKWPQRFGSDLGDAVVSPGKDPDVCWAPVLAGSGSRAVSLHGWAVAWCILSCGGLQTSSCFGDLTLQPLCTHIYWILNQD